nr:MAG TPA: hypothetical protein [Caudoviricetes sp.]
MVCSQWKVVKKEAFILISSLLFAYYWNSP